MVIFLLLRIYAGQSLSVAPFENVLESFENANLDHIHKLFFTRKWGVFIMKLSSQCFCFICHKRPFISNQGVRRFVPDEFVFGVLDYLFAIGGWGFGVGVLGFWAWDEFLGRIVTDSNQVCYL